MKKRGFTLIEILLVVIIIGILASISAPMFLQHQKRAVASESVAAMALVRQALRDYFIVHDTYYDVGAGNIKNALPTSVSAGTPTPSSAGVDVDVNVAKYFSNAAYSIDATSPSSARFTNPPAVDFLITVNGADSVACSSTVQSDCAISPTAVSKMDLEMDNSGRIFVSYDNGSNWTSY